MLLKEIRSRTADNHARLENTPLLSSFSRQRIDMPTYLEILRRFYGYFGPLESRLDAFPALREWLPDYTERRKARLLLDDLESLHNPVEPDPCRELPGISTDAQAFGCLYVMEGSTLGGKIIYNTLKNQLGLDKSTGASFFYGYGPATGEKWKTFGSRMEAFGRETGTDDAIIAAANDTFLMFEQWLQTKK
jgi:heme oxygenase